MPAGIPVAGPVTLATPELFSAAVARVSPLAEKVTFPVGIPGPDFLATVAVSVVLPLTTMLEGFATSVVVVAALVGELTVRLSDLEEPVY